MHNCIHSDIYGILCQGCKSMKYDAYSIGQRAFNARHNKNIKQKEMSEVLDIAQSSYSRFENGQYDLPLSKVIQLCDYLGISVSWLVNEPGAAKLTEQELIELEQYKNYLISKRNKK